MKRIVFVAAVLLAVFILPSKAKPIDELRRLQDRGYSWQLYISEQNDEPAVCVLLQRDGKNFEGCADSISGAIKAAKRKL